MAGIAGVAGVDLFTACILGPEILGSFVTVKIEF